MTTHGVSSKLKLFDISCRKFFVSLLLSLSFVLLPPSLFSMHAQDGVIVYTVVYGDTLSSIAHRYNVTVADLLAHNNIRNANVINPGQTIVIPTRRIQPAPTRTPTPVAQPSRAPTTQIPVIPTRLTTATPPPTLRTSPPGYTAAGEPFYIVRRGDTLNSIARLYKVTYQRIMERNGLTSTVLTVNQRLIIPLPAGPVSTPATPTPAPTSVKAPGEAVTGTLPDSPAEEMPTPTSAPEPTSVSLVTATPESPPR